MAAGGLGRGAVQQILKKMAAENQGILGDAEMYRSNLEKAAYAQASPEFSQGIGRITNYLAGSGPLADSGARTALLSRLSGQIYGGIRGKVAGGYSDFLGNLLQQRRQHRYNMELAKYMKGNKSAIGQIARVGAGVGVGVLSGNPMAGVGAYGALGT